MTPAGIRIAVATLVAASVTLAVARRAVVATRPVAILLIAAVLFRTAALAIPLFRWPEDLDPSAPIAVLSTVLVGATLAALTTAIVMALLTRDAQDFATWLLIAALAGVAIGGLGLSAALRVGAD